MNTGTWKVGTSISVASCLLMLAFFLADARPVLAQEACAVPAGVTPPDPSVTARQVESGSATLEEFGLELRDQLRSQSRGITNLEQVAYFGCLVRQEGGPWRSGSTYLVQLTPDGRIFAHARDMSLSGRLLHPLIYGQILIALGASATDVASLRDPATAAGAYASILATLLQEPAALFDASAPVAGVSPGFPGASGHASVYFSPTWRVPFLVLTGFELNASHVLEEPIDYGDPTVTARDVVDRKTLKEFVTQAGNFFIESRKKGNVAALSKARIALRDPNGPWRHGSVYLYVLDLDSNVILVHGAFPNRFELKPLVPTVRDAVTGEFVLPQVIAAAKSDPEGGFLEYYWDDPTDDTDRADIPKVGYAREFSSQIQRTDGSVIPVNLIVGSGFYRTPAAVAGDHNAVIEAVLPQVMRAMTASTVDAVSSRIAEAGSGAAPTAELSLGGSSTLADVLMANGVALENGTFDPGRLLAGASFTLPLAAAGGADGGPLGNLTLWGSGDWRNISGGSSQSVAYDGSVMSANLGVDTRLAEDFLAGVSLGRSRGSVDYTESGASTGEFTTTVTSITPYMGWQGSAGMSLWALAGHGWGEVEIEDAAGMQSSDMTQFMVAAGFAGTLVSSDEVIAGGTTRLRMKGDAAFTEAEIDGSGTIEAVTLDAGRHRLTLEGSHTRRLESGAAFTPSLEVGMRNDVGAGETGTGIEAGGGLRFADAATGFTVEVRARTLLSHSGDSEEWGVSGLVRLDPGSAGRGLALSVQPAWGETASGVERLWQTGVVPGERASGGARLEARVGYGMALLGGRATGTPELALGLSEASRDWRLGWTLGLARTERASFHFSLEATRWEPANGDATPENRVGVTASMRW